MSGQEPIETILPAGSRLGPYEIIRLLGSGAFADVYLARHTLLEKEVALKVVRASETEAAEVQGAKIMCRLQHPNIVSVHFADRIEGRLVIEMDYVEGRTLREILNESGPFDIDRSLEIASAVASAIEYVHSFELKGSSGLAHLDLKPSNILVDSKGTIKITDFGMAQVLHYEGGEAIRVGGSPAYMAPEQYEGKPLAQSDIWAVGVLLYEMLIGKPPFRAESIKEYHSRICEAGPELGSSFRELPKTLQDIILCCLKRDPGERFASARELSSAIDTMRSASTSATCPRCGRTLPAGSSVCTECTFRDQKKVGRSEVARRILKKQSRKSSKAVPWIVAAVLILLVATTYGAYQFWKKWRPEHTARRTMARAELEQKLPELNQAHDAWVRTLKLEKSAGGTYQDKIQSLKAFLQKYPDTNEAKEATNKLKVWEEEAKEFGEAEDLESRPAVKLCEKLAKWNEFHAQQKTGFRRARAWERIQYWTKEVENYSGYAELTVKSAAGLPPSNARFIGSDKPDPYFVLLEKKKTVYESRICKGNPAPVWEEKVRVFISPSSDLVLEIRDKNLIGYSLLFRQSLIPLPVDGAFRLTSGTIQIQLQVQREK